MQLPIAAIVHEETYKTPSDAEVLAAYQTKEVEGRNRYMANDELRHLIETADVQNLAQVYTKIKYTQDSHQEYSRQLLLCLEKQGHLA